MEINCELMLQLISLRVGEWHLADKLAVEQTLVQVAPLHPVVSGSLNDISTELVLKSGGQ